MPAEVIQIAEQREYFRESEMIQSIQTMDTLDVVNLIDQLERASATAGTAVETINIRPKIKLTGIELQPEIL